jgi:hypothetical protein
VVAEPGLLVEVIPFTGKASNTDLRDCPGHALAKLVWGVERHVGPNDGLDWSPVGSHEPTVEIVGRVVTPFPVYLACGEREDVAETLVVRDLPREAASHVTLVGAAAPNIDFTAPVIENVDTWRDAELEGRICRTVVLEIQTTPTVLEERWLHLGCVPFRVAACAEVSSMERRGESHLLIDPFPVGGLFDRV